MLITSSAWASTSATSATVVEITNGGIMNFEVSINYVQKQSLYSTNTFLYPLSTKSITLNILQYKLARHDLFAIGYRRIGSNT